MELGSLDIIDYWFSENSEKYWFSSTPEIDKEIKQHYEQLWQSAADGMYDEWQNSPEGSLALVIILDQFPLNMFRGQPKSFQTESKAIKILSQNKLVKEGKISKLDFLIKKMSTEERKKIYFKLGSLNLEQKFFYQLSKIIF